MRLLLFAGAGTSVELGVPAMEGMAIEFLAHCEQWDVEPALVRALMGEVLDMEHLIESLDQMHSARGPLEVLGNSTALLDHINTIRSETEWFVQHAAERIAAPDAALMWGAVLRRAKDHELAFVTTNYDRAIELAANAEGLSLVDGYETFGESESVAWVGFNPTKSKTSIVKLHGSTDWYTDRGSNQPLKLRHPMPLFGRTTLRLSGGAELGSALILPSREKLLTMPPYPRLSQAFLNAADSCEGAVIVGSSLRDSHIRNATIEMAKQRPVFLVNPGGNSLGIDNVKTIAQTASEFLISTLPAGLTHADPLAFLGNVSGAVSPTKGSSILDLLRIVLNVDEGTERRCRALDNLDQRSVTLDEALIRKLISGEDGTVARYALGLVATAPARDRLLGAASESPHAQDKAFAEELALLRLMIKDDGASMAGTCASAG